jgi:hypothetical protein
MNFDTLITEMISSLWRHNEESFLRKVGAIIWETLLIVDNNEEINVTS